MATAKKTTTPLKTAAKKVSVAPVKKLAPAKPGPGSKKQAAKAPLTKTVKAKPVKTVKPAKVEKPKKPKLVRDSFTIPKAEYLVLDTLKLRATKLTRPAKKSELLRAGIKALAALSDAAFLTALEQVPAIKTGRPAGSK
ncbi:MAG: hypothetical protein V4614_03040 [Pseudomonadota bacterium]